MVNIIKFKRWLEGPQKVKYGTVVKETVAKGLILDGILVERFTNEKSCKRINSRRHGQQKAFLKHCFILLNMLFYV